MLGTRAFQGFQLQLFLAGLPEAVPYAALPSVPHRGTGAVALTGEPLEMRRYGAGVTRRGSFLASVQNGRISTDFY